jgi:hypothetical protein
MHNPLQFLQNKPFKASQKLPNKRTKKGLQPCKFQEQPAVAPFALRFPL